MFLKKLILRNLSRRQQKHEKLPSMQRVNYMCVFIRACSLIALNMVERTKNAYDGNNTPLEPDCCYLHVFYYIDRLVSALYIISNCDIQMFLHFSHQFFCIQYMETTDRERNVTFLCVNSFPTTYSICLCS